MSSTLWVEEIRQSHRRQFRSHYSNVSRCDVRSYWYVEDSESTSIWINVTLIKFYQRIDLISWQFKITILRSVSDLMNDQSSEMWVVWSNFLIKLSCLISCLRFCCIVCVSSFHHLVSSSKEHRWIWHMRIIQTISSQETSLRLSVLLIEDKKNKAINIDWMSMKW